MLDRYPDFNVKVQNIIIGELNRGVHLKLKQELKESLSEKAKEEKTGRIKKRKWRLLGRWQARWILADWDNKPLFLNFFTFSSCCRNAPLTLRKMIDHLPFLDRAEIVETSQQNIWPSFWHTPWLQTFNAKQSWSLKGDDKETLPCYDVY